MPTGGRARPNINANTFRAGRLLHRVLCVTYVILVGFAYSLSPGIAASVGAAASTSPGGSIYFGVVYPQAPDIPTLQGMEAELQHNISLVLWYQSWEMANQPQAFPAAQMDAVRTHGSIPVLAWYPMDGTVSSTTQPAFTLARIIDGSWDAYVRQYAADVKAWGHPFFLRFASEMNGSWIPWSEMSNGNHTGQYVQAWRHVHDIFTQVGVTNATWTWCPNTEDSTTTPLEGLYPGSAYVDWACMDGYNFAADLGGSPWRSFSKIFRGTYQHVLALIPPSMPIMIGEMASSEHGGSKPDWIRDAMTVQLPGQFPRIKGLIWFNSTNPGIDLRIDTSPQSLAALRTALASGAYESNTYRFLDQSPIPAPGGVDPKPSVPPVYHDVTSPAAGYVQLLDSTHNAPLPNARLVYAEGTSPATNAQGLVAMPDDVQQVTLEAISVSGGMLAVSVTLDRRLGYQIQVDMATGEVLNIRAHDPPPPPAPPGPAAVAVSALKSAPTPWVAMIGLGALTLLIVIVMVMRIGVRAWRRGARTERRRIAAPNRSHTRVG